MGKDRTITGFGPTKLSVTNTTGVKTGDFIKFGPFIGNTFGANITFGTATSNAVCIIQGAISTASTGGFTTLVSRTGNQSGTAVRGTSTHVFAYVRVRSTARGTSTAANAMTAYFAAVP